MKHPIRKALTAILVMTLPFCGGLVPNIPMRVSAAGGSASDIYANSISSIPLSDAAARMAAAPVGGPRPSFRHRRKNRQCGGFRREWGRPLQRHRSH